LGANDAGPQLAALSGVILNNRGAIFKRSRSTAFLTTQVRALAITGLTLSTIVVMALLPRIEQDEAYHRFADQRSMFGMSNFLNVVSNLPFLLTGVAGLLFLTRHDSASSGSFINRFERWPYIVFFFGVTLACFGSAYYHLSPSTDRLMWDRLPMSIAFMSLFATVIAERIHLRAGLVSLTPLVLVGVGSVIYWHVGEQSGNGDLRPYILVQFYSLLAIVLSAIIFPSRYTRSGELLGATGFYVLAKVVEVLDAQVFSIGRIVSGHTLKHILAALAAYWILRMLRHRMPAPNSLAAIQA
jgi:hypothetical protein